MWRRVSMALCAGVTVLGLVAVIWGIQKKKTEPVHAPDKKDIEAAADQYVQKINQKFDQTKRYALHSEDLDLLRKNGLLNQTDQAVLQKLTQNTKF